MPAAQGGAVKPCQGTPSTFSRDAHRLHSARNLCSQPPSSFVRPSRLTTPAASQLLLRPASGPYAAALTPCRTGAVVPVQPVQLLPPAPPTRQPAPLPVACQSQALVRPPAQRDSPSRARSSSSPAAARHRERPAAIIVGGAAALERARCTPRQIPESLPTPTRLLLPSPFRPLPAAPLRRRLLSDHHALDGASTAVPPRTGTSTRALACPHCRYPLTWHSPRPFTVCGRCSMSVPLVVAEPPRPDLDSVYELFPGHAADNQQLLPSDLGRTLSPAHVGDYASSTVRAHPHTSDLVVVSRARCVVAVLSRSVAAYTRYVALTHWYRVSASMRANEADVAALMVAMLLACPQQLLLMDVPGRHPASDHVFMPWLAHTEPGVFRPASLPPDSAAFTYDRDVYCPGTSAYAPVVTRLPLVAEAFERQLRLPDGVHSARSFIVNGVCLGFSMMTSPPTQPRRVRRHDTQHRQPAFQRALREEVEMGAFLVAPPRHTADSPRAPSLLRTAPIFGIVKSSGSTRLVPDMSFGDGSNNAHTSKAALGKARLASVARICSRVAYLRAQRPAEPVMIAKLDVKSAYRNVPIPLRERWCHAHDIGSAVYVHAAMPFGSSAACAVMTTITTALEDILATRGVFCPFYVDDGIVVAYECDIWHHRQQVLDLMADVGLPVSRSKLATDGKPDTRKEVLGVLIDTVACTASITPHRVATIVTTIRDILDAADGHGVVPSSRQYSSLAGTLQFVASVVPLAKVFLRSLYKRAAGLTDTPGPAVPSDVRADLDFWLHAIRAFSGVAVFAQVDGSPAPGRVGGSVTTDASSSGYGVYACAEAQYACGVWSAHERTAFGIAHRECATVGLAAQLFGPRCAGGELHVLCDNMATVLILRSRSCRDQRMYELLRQISLHQLAHSYLLCVEHIPGADNTISDYLSRHNAFPFHLLPPAAPRPARLSVSSRRPGAHRTIPLLGSQQLEPWLSDPSPAPLTAPVTPCACTTSTAPPSPTHHGSHRVRMPWRLTLPTLVDSSTSSAGCITPGQRPPSPRCGRTYPPSGPASLSTASH